MLSLSVAVLEIRRGCEVGGKHVAATVVEAHIVDVDPSRACRATELRGRGRRRSARSCGGSVRADITPPPPPRGPVLHVNPAGTVTSFPTAGAARESATTVLELG